jgi:hypothetical protein
MGHLVRIGKERNACRLLVGKTERKRRIAKPKCTSVDNIKMDLGDVAWGDVGCIGLSKDTDT